MQWTPAWPGQYVVEVGFSGFHLAGSPFQVLVAPPRLVAGHTEGTHTVTLWAAADPVRVAARNLVDLLRARLVTAPAA